MRDGAEAVHRGILGADGGVVFLHRITRESLPGSIPYSSIQFAVLTSQHHTVFDNNTTHKAVQHSVSCKLTLTLSPCAAFTQRTRARPRATTARHAAVNPHTVLVTSRVSSSPLRGSRAPYHHLPGCLRWTYFTRPAVVTSSARHH